MISLSLPQIAHAVGVDADSLTKNQAAVTVLRVCIDSRDTKPGDLYIAIPGERFDGHQFVHDAFAKGAVAAVVSNRAFDLSCSPATPCLLVKNTIAALGALGSYYRQEIMSASTRVVAITGSNGKTTAKCMLDHVLSATWPGSRSPKSFNNHIGVPLTLLSAERGDRYLVVEIGSNAPGEVGALAVMTSPDVGVVTSVGLAHLEGLGDLSSVAEEKCSLLRSVRSDGLAVVNTDQHEVRAQVQVCLQARPTCRLITVGSNDSANLRIQAVSQTLENSVFLLNDRFRVTIPMPGSHHAANAAVVFAIARWFGLAPDQIIERLKSFVAQDGRTKVIHVGSVSLVDDTYNANPASMLAAIDGLAHADAQRKIFVMGDMLELGQKAASLHDDMVTRALSARFDLIVTLGKAMKDAVSRSRVTVPDGAIMVCDDRDEVDLAIQRFVEPGDVIWLKGSRAMRLDCVVEKLQQGPGELGTRSAVA